MKRQPEAKQQAQYLQRFEYLTVVERIDKCRYERHHYRHDESYIFILNIG